MELSCLVVRGEVRGTGSSKYPVVVCSAAGKSFHATHEALVYPRFEHVRIKTAARMPDGRYVVRLKGVARKRLTPGTLLIGGGQPVYRSRVGYAISRSNIAPGDYRLQGGLFREHLPHGTVRVTRAASGYRLSASSELPLVGGGRYRLKPAGEASAAGAEVLLCLPGEVERRERSHLGAVLAILAARLSGGGLPHAEIEAGILQLTGWVLVSGEAEIKPLLDAAASLFPWPSGLRTGETADLIGPAGTRLLVGGGLYVELSAAVERAIGRSPGSGSVAIADALSYPHEVVQGVAEGLLRAGRVVRTAGLYRRAGAGAGLSPIEKGTLESLRRQAGEGLVRAGMGLDREILDDLVRRRVVVRLGDRYCPMDTYDLLVKRLLAGRRPGEAIAVSEAKGILGLAREQTVQFLESLDQEGLLRRESAIHRVVRGPGAARR